MKKLILPIIFALNGSLFAQTESKSSNLTFSGYLETYYGYDFANPDDHLRPAGVYSHNKHNEVNLNLGFVKAAYSSERLRGNLAVMAGTYADANLASESPTLQNIFEANVGVKLSENKNLWIDAGIFASHIGFESAVGKDCWNLTRSILADNSPYYESGVKVSYTSPSGKWFVSGLLLNGWQRIQRVEGNNTLAFGHQITFKPSAKVTLNSSSFVGSDSPDIDRKMRYFHNFYGQFQLTDKFGLIAGFDIGAQQTAKKSKTYHSWYSPVLIGKYALSSKSTLAARAEYYNDENQVIIATNSPNGFQTASYSVNYDYQITTNAVWRIEARGFSSKDRIYTYNDAPAPQNYLVTTALAFSF